MCVLSSIKDIFSLLLEREEHQCGRETLTGYLSYVPGLGTKPATFQLQAMLYPPEPHWPGQKF